jgi:hypothetical protein
MASKKHVRLAPAVFDKHLDGITLAAVIDRRAINAIATRPSRAYRGTFASDEDFADVLQLGWENEVIVFSADGEMIEKAQCFEPQFGKAECCLRGLILLPPDKNAQVEVLRDFAAGKLVPIRTRKGDALPTTIDQVEDFNVCIDLRQQLPRVIHLCACED